jgi:hypothetical protein
MIFIALLDFKLFVLKGISLRPPALNVQFNYNVDLYKKIIMSLR